MFMKSITKVQIKHGSFMNIFFFCGICWGLLPGRKGRWVLRWWCRGSRSWSIAGPAAKRRSRQTRTRRSHLCEDEVYLQRKKSVRKCQVVVSPNILAIKTDLSWETSLARFLILLINNNSAKCWPSCLSTMCIS
jgi:hypothetical protein